MTTAITVDVAGTTVEVMPKPGWTIGAIGTHARWLAKCGSVPFDQWEHRDRDGQLLDPAVLIGDLTHIIVNRLAGIGG